MNKHIEKYLKSYLELNKPEFAVLLTGKWGSGKTYFIDEFIEIKDDKQEKIKFIKISLFGLKELDAIDEQIFQNLHPVMGNKYVKLTGNIAKNALKLGVKLDWNDDDKSDGTSSIDLSKFNPLDWFSDKKKSKEKIIFIFDDLERTDIELTEVLGYINYLVEQSEFNVIILANEEKIVEEENKNETTKYKEFKEKVIGKTFEVQHDFEKILTSLIRENTKKSKKYLNQNKSIIIDIYAKAGHHNLRHIKQILLDFEYFSKDIYKKYLDNKEFVSILINNFFALSIEIKSGSLSEEELKLKPNFMFDFINKDNKKEKSNVEKIYEKYSIKDTEIFSGEGWVIVLFKSSISKVVINEVFSRLSFFIKDEKKEQPSWVKLWHYRELEDNEFEIVKKDVLEKFNKFEYETPQHFLHVIALLLFLRKKGLCDLSLEDIEKQVSMSIEKYKKIPIWKDNLFNNDRFSFNRTGLGYMDEESEEFRKFYKLVMDENKEIYDENKKLIEKNKLDKLLEAIKQKNQEVIKTILLDEYKEKPIFKDLSPMALLTLLTTIGNKNLTEFGYVLGSRYPDYHSVNNQPYHCYYFKEELKFWKKLDEELTKYLDNKNSKKLSIVRLEEFHEYSIKKLVEKLENCD